MENNKVEDAMDVVVEEQSEVETQLPEDVQRSEEDGDVRRENDETEPRAEKLTRFPLGRVKTIMKSDPDTSLASGEAVFAVAKATELFVESLAKEVAAFTVMNKKKTLSRLDVDTAVDATECLAFLEGALED